MDSIIPFLTNPTEATVSRVNSNNKARLERWIRANRLSILVTGRSGAGKSALINAIVGDLIAEEGDIGAYGGGGVTKVAKPYSSTIRRIPVTVIDSPGLQDLDDEQFSDDRIIADIKAKLTEATRGHIDIVLYCVSMTSRRLDSGDTRAIRHLSEQFPGIWDKTVFVLTHANQYRLKPHERADESLNKGIGHLKEAIMNALQKVGQSQQNITVVPAGYYEASPQDINSKDCRYLPGYKDDWLSTLWAECAVKLRGEAQLAMVAMSSHRFTSSDTDIVWPSSSRGHQWPIVVSSSNVSFQLIGALMIECALIGGEIGIEYGRKIGRSYSAMGEVVGGVLGGALGGTFGGVAGGLGGAILCYLKFWP